MMAAVAARELADGEVVFVGIGLPNLACNLARATHAPRLVLIYESGAVGAVPERLPVSIGDPALVTGSLMVCGMADVFQLILQNGRIGVGFLGGAQIDRSGNINTTVIGTYERPTVRLPGSGGGAEIAIHARRAPGVAAQGDADSLAVRVRKLADAYVAGYFERHPDEATLDGVAGVRHDRLPDNSPITRGRWQAREDRWLAELRRMDPDPLAGRA